ncbi:hypothetical protein BIY20_08900 [Vibrio panuliri]|uniref:Secreted protein n=1 Tax=Vibrio panuliri TaxID=1381081 RepID=A0ABX3FGG9_9VIBR|nr:hypothetical protein BIY20_08900 [Vibrio panuliri]
MFFIVFISHATRSANLCMANVSQKDEQDSGYKPKARRDQVHSNLAKHAINHYQNTNDKKPC